MLDHRFNLYITKISFIGTIMQIAVQLLSKASSLKLESRNEDFLFSEFIKDSIPVSLLSLGD